MPKRTIWFSVGATLGASAGIWTKYKIDKKLKSTTPLRVGLDALVTTKNVAKKAVAALEAGAKEAKATKTKLTSEILDPKIQRNP